MTPAPLALPPRFGRAKVPGAAWHLEWGRRARSAPWTAPREATSARRRAPPAAGGSRPRSAARSARPRRPRARRYLSRAAPKGARRLWISRPPRARPLCPPHPPRLRPPERSQEHRSLPPPFRGAPGQPPAPGAGRGAAGRALLSSALVLLPEPSCARASRVFLGSLFPSHLPPAAPGKPFVRLGTPRWVPPSGPSACRALGLLGTLLASDSAGAQTSRVCGFPAALLTAGWGRRGAVAGPRVPGAP